MKFHGRITCAVILSILPLSPFLPGAYVPLGISAVRRCQVQLPGVPEWLLLYTFSPAAESTLHLTLSSCFCQGSWWFSCIHTSWESAPWAIPSPSHCPELPPTPWGYQLYLWWTLIVDEFMDFLWGSWDPDKSGNVAGHLFVSRSILSQLRRQPAQSSWRTFSRVFPNSTCWHTRERPLVQPRSTLLHTISLKLPDNKKDVNSEIWFTSHILMSHTHL